MTREQMIATFELYGWRPGAKIRGGASLLTMVVLWNQELRRSLYLDARKGAILVRSHPERPVLQWVEYGGRREHRDWSAISLPTMHKLHVRLMLWLANKPLKQPVVEEES